MNKKENRSGPLSTILRISIILAAILLFTTIQSVGSITPGKSTMVTLDVAYGLDGVVKAGRYAPFAFHMKNQNSEDFFGMLQIIVRQDGTDHFLYEKEVVIPANQTVDETFAIPLADATDQLFVKLVDDGHEIMAQERIKLKMKAWETGYLYVGLLSDDMKSLSFFNNVSLNDGAMTTKSIEMQMDYITDNPLDIDMLDMIIVNDFDTSRFTTDQISAIMDWVHNGGTLLFGTGDEVEKTLAGFKELFPSLWYKQQQILKTDLGVAHFSADNENNYVNIPYNRLEVQDGKVLFRSAESPLITSIANERGIVSFSGFDFTDITQYASLNDDYIPNILVEVFTKERLQMAMDETLYGMNNQYWSVSTLVSSGNIQRIPNPNKYALVLIVYIIFVGPGGYLFLKKMDKRQYYRQMVFSLSVICSLVIYFMGTNTRFQEPFLNYATIKEVERDFVNETSYLNIRAPYNEEYSVDINNSYEVRPLAKDNYAYFENDDLNGLENCMISLNYREDMTKISIQDVVAFTSSLFELTRRFESKDAGKVVCDVKIFGQEISGSITNNLGYDLEQASLIMYGQAVVFGDIKDGETVQLEEYKVTVYPLNYFYDTAKQMTGNSQFKKPSIHNEAYNLSFERANLLQHYMSTHFSNNTVEARLVGFIKERNENTFAVDGAYKAYGISLHSFPVTVNYKNGDRMYYPYLKKEPKLINGNYWATGNVINGTEPVTLEYSIGEWLEVETVILATPGKESSSMLYTPFNGAIYFYNYGTQSFDKINKEHSSFSKEDLIGYLDPYNKITIKYELSEHEVSQYDIVLPIVSVIGRESYAEN